MIWPFNLFLDKKSKVVPGSIPSDLSCSVTSSNNLLFCNFHRFIKSRITAHIKIVEHFATACVEVIVVDVDKNIEGNRIYLSSKSITEMKKAPEYNMKRRLHTELLLRKKLYFPARESDMVFMRVMLVHFLTNHLMVHYENAESASDRAKLIVELDISRDDCFNFDLNDMLITERPLGIKRVNGFRVEHARYVIVISHIHLI